MAEPSASDDPEPDLVAAAAEHPAPEPVAGALDAAAPEAPTLQSLTASLGGPLGIAESMVPATAFVVVATASGQDTRLAAIVAVSLAAVFALARMARRQTPVYAVSGVIGVAIAGYVASRTGKAENFFLPGLLLNVAYAMAYLVSIAVRWPLIGVIVAAVGRTGNGWRDHPDRLRAYTRASWVWVGLFLSRIAVQLPLYLAGALVALGTARIAMGVPLFIVGAWLSWLVLRSTERPRQRPGG
jgi:hypothetical protein